MLGGKGKHAIIVVAWDTSLENVLRRKDPTRKVDPKERVVEKERGQVRVTIAEKWDILPENAPNPKCRRALAREMSKAKGKVEDFLGDATTVETLGTGHRNAAYRGGSMRWKKRESRNGEISGP